MEAGPTKRIAFTVHYDGSAYHGWQRQRGQASVQGELERVLSRLFDSPARVLGSGRTDRGVHSVGQVAAVDAPARWEAAELRRAMNALLPPAIWIAAAARVTDDFHPRYGATARSYVYRVGLAELTASPFHARWCWSLRRPLRMEALAAATRDLIGEHSFRGFAKSGQEERGDRCLVREAEWRPWEGLGVEFHIEANRFLHHMVRYLVGTLVEIGLERRPVEDVGLILAGEHGVETSPPAPARGLFLSRVTYPDGTYIPRSGRGPDQGLLPSTIG